MVKKERSMIADERMGMMEITREVILDLMPLYVADEVSEDTRKLVEAYLETDEDLKHLAECVE